MFKEFCADIVSRYGLEDLVKKAEVQDITYEQADGIFTLRTSTGIRKAKMVILAIGPALERRLPPDCPFSAADQQNGSVIHVFGTQTTGELPPHVLEKIKARKQTNVVVVGGGLTSAQITDTLARSGVTKVHHLMRRPMNSKKYRLYSSKKILIKPVKQFDVDLAWAGKFRNREMSAFWCSDCDKGILKFLLSPLYYLT